MTNGQYLIINNQYYKWLFNQYNVENRRRKQWRREEEEREEEKIYWKSLFYYYYCVANENVYLFNNQLIQWQAK